MRYTRRCGHWVWAENAGRKVQSCEPPLVGCRNHTQNYATSEIRIQAGHAICLLIRDTKQEGQDWALNEQSRHAPNKRIFNRTYTIATIIQPNETRTLAPLGIGFDST